jgi:glycosyltransferase involved in cell wall biosynthesis
MLLHALRTTNLPIVVVGPRRDVLYARFCAEHASRNCRFIEHLSDEHLASAYRAAKVTVLPGWIDSPISPWLEAALAGCALAVSNRLNANEALGSYACTFDPADPAAIRKAVLQACSHHKADASKRDQLAGQLRTHNTYTEAARLVISAYQSALAASKSGRHAARPPAIGVPAIA